MRALLLALMAVPGQAPDGRAEGIDYGNGTIPGAAPIMHVEGSIPIPPEPINADANVAEAEGIVADPDTVIEAMEKVAVGIKAFKEVLGESQDPAKRDQLDKIQNSFLHAQAAYGINDLPGTLLACSAALDLLDEAKKTPSLPLDSSTGPSY